MKNFKLGRMSKFTALVLGIVLSANTYALAANALYPNWNLMNVSSQTRVLTEDYSGSGAIIGGGSLFNNVSNTSLTINGLTVSTESDVQAAYDQGSDFVAGGVVYDATANKNTINVISSTIQGRTVIGGASFMNDWDKRLSTGTVTGSTVNNK